MYLIGVRDRKIKPILISALTVSTLLGFILFFNPGINSRIFKTLMDFSHVFVFGLIAIIINKGLDKKRRAETNRIIAFLAAVFLGFVIEIIQLGMKDRFFEIDDLLNDAIGAVAFLAIAADYETRSKALFMRTLSVMLIILAGLPFYISCIYYRLNLNRFPVINSFESTLETSSWEKNRAKIIRTVLSGKKDYSAELILLPGEFSGVCREGFVHDWRGYKIFSADVYLPAEKYLSITLRINDMLHNNEFDDRFNRRIMLKPGLNHISINLEDIRKSPATRPMDLRNVTRICFFTTGLAEQETVYLDNIRLD